MRQIQGSLIPVKTLRQAALDAGVDERTAAKVVAGLPVRPAGRDRMLEALARHGVDVSRISIGVIQAGAAQSAKNPTSEGAAR